jgi:hypothetical protein
MGSAVAQEWTKYLFHKGRPKNSHSDTHRPLFHLVSSTVPSFLRPGPVFEELTFAEVDGVGGGARMDKIFTAGRDNLENSDPLSIALLTLQLNMLSLMLWVV